MNRTTMFRRHGGLKELLVALPFACGCHGGSAQPTSDGAPADEATVVKDVGPQTSSPPDSPATNSDGLKASCPASDDLRFRDLELASPALGTSVWVRLLVPPGWTEHPTKTWPLLLLLPGHSASYQAWSCDTFVKSYVGDAQIIVAMPDGTDDYTLGQPPDSLASTACGHDASLCGGTPGWYSDWYNGGDAGPPRWETFHLVELLNLLEGRFGASTTRAVAGLSMGGFGAVAYAARHPGTFRAAASYSGVLDPASNVIDQLAVESTLSMAGANPDALWGDPKTDAGLTIWRAHDPTDLAAQLLHLPLFVAAGNGCHGPYDDPPNTCAETDVTESLVSAMTKSFVSALTTASGGHLASDVDVDLYGNGTHTWAYWDRDLCRSLPMLASALGVSLAQPTCSAP
jgi:diacylglycerol O-acyltransferase / trehalose O-mycolyltransferase